MILEKEKMVLEKEKTEKSHELERVRMEVSKERLVFLISIFSFSFIII